MGEVGRKKRKKFAVWGYDEEELVIDSVSKEEGSSARRFHHK